jgi:Glycosyl hydrolase catalytic core
VAAFAAVVALAALLALPASTARASSRMLVGIVDDAQTLYGNPDHTYPILKKLRVQVIRVNLYWGGRFGVAKRRPSLATNPNDPAYDWRLFDRAVTYANRFGIKVLFSVIGTPSWANGGATWRRAPTNADDLRKFSFAAAKRYSGTFVPAKATTKLPAVRLWLAWNEPNNPINLAPQYRRVSGKWVIQSAIDYARICEAVWRGVHQTGLAGERVACGATAPHGNNAPRTSRPSVSPLVFLRALKKAGLRHFDAYAHHPYSGSPYETPTSRPPARTALTMGNLDDLVSELTRLYGAKRIWITEYGYQTSPPDRRFGVTWAQQARYLTQAFAIARKNPRIDMMVWFLLRDDSVLSGWQSGFFTSQGVRKPAYDAFRRLPH